MGGLSNCSGSVSARPSEVAKPNTEDELKRIIREAGKLRAVGAPQARRFREVRAGCDPSGKFLNSHLAALCGPEPFSCPT